MTNRMNVMREIRRGFPAEAAVTKVTVWIHKIPAELKNMPRNGGTTLRMRRYNPLATAPVPLGPGGITPPPQQLTSLNVDAQMDFYGTFILMNEQVTLNCGVNKLSLIDLECLDAAA